MELPFEKTVCRYWKQKLYTLHNQEQTQELRIPDGMEDASRVISCWGQIVMRGKDVNERSLGVQGGIMVWVLYQAEGDGQLHRLESWIPFRSRIDLPAGDGDGVARVQCLLRNVDTRILSGRRMMIRCGLGLLVQVLVPGNTEISIPKDLPEDVEVLRSRYPMLLTVEAGEKYFTLEEELEIPGILSPVSELIYYQLEPELVDQKVLGGKGLFHGIANLHVLYRNEEGRLCCHDFQLPFAQYIELEEDYEDEAQIRNLLCLTSLELELQEDGILFLRCAFVSQYTIQNRSVLDLVEDAYSPLRNVEVNCEMLTLPAVLDTVLYTMDLTGRFQGEELTPIDSSFRRELPRFSRQGSELHVAQDGSFRILGEDKGNSLRDKAVKAEGVIPLQLDESAQAAVFTWPKGAVNTRREGADWRTDTQMILDLSAVTGKSVPMVTGMRLEEEPNPDERQSCVIIRKKERGERLWDLAKRCGSTVGAITRINHLQMEPEEGQLLLIPVP